MIPSVPVAPNPIRLDLPVLGMTCAACVRRVERALTAVPGVAEAAVNLVTRRATVSFDPTRTSRADLEAAVVGAGYEVPRPVERAAEDPGAKARLLEQAEEAEQRQLNRDVLLSAALTVPLLVVAMSHGAMPWTEGPLGRSLQLVLATPVIFGPGRRFLRLAVAAARHRSADMNTLVAIGALAAWGWSAAAVLAPSLFPHGEHVAPHLYFEAGAAIVSFVLLGKWMETRARRRLSDAVRGLVSLVPKTATRIGTTEEQVPVALLVPGDRVRVRPGERVPVDGEIARGSGTLDESMLTGESDPVDKGQGEAVFGGTLNQAGSFELRVTRTGADTALSRIVEAVEQAQGSRAPIARLADRVSAVFVPVVLTIAMVTGLVWMLLDPSSAGLATAVERFVAVLVIACPCALGLATPAAVAVGTGRGAELGILVKGGEALEVASRVDLVLLDKTGTLTAGKPTLTDVVAAGLDERELLGLVASVEAGSEHPVAWALVEGARARGALEQSVEGFRSSPGDGVEGTVGARRVRIGTAAWLAQAGVSTAALESEAEGLASRGHTPAFVAVDGRLAGLVAVADRPTEEARAAVAALRAAGIQVAMVTGDRLATARAVAAELGIETVHAGVRPEGKAAVVAEARARGRVVAMVGDGVNDAPALAAAHLGVAVGTGTDIAVATADLALLRVGIGRLPQALRLARATLGTIRRNLFWAFAYNVVSIPVAAGLLYPWTGWLLSPVLASAAMSLSSVSVLLSSLSLRTFERGQA